MASPHLNQKQESYERLRPLLLHGQLQAGQRMAEIEWAQRLGVHRGALREAFGLLVHEGLLVEGERGGYFVPTFEATDLQEILELRAALEGGALRHLTQHGEPVAVDPLRQLCQTMQWMADADMPLGFAEADRKFHEQIIALAGNQRMIRAYQQAPVVITASPYLSPESQRQNMQQTLQEHQAICDLLDAGRFSDAAEQLEYHLLHTHRATAHL